MFHAHLTALLLFRTLHVYISRDLRYLNRSPTLDQPPNCSSRPNQMDDYNNNNIWLIYVPQSVGMNSTLSTDVFSSTHIRLDSLMFMFHEQREGKKMRTLL